MALFWDHPTLPNDRSCLGTLLFDTSAESWLAQSRDPAVGDWLRRYLDRHEIHVSAVTVVERVRGYGMLLRHAPESERGAAEGARAAYLAQLGLVWPLDLDIAVVAGDLLAILPYPPSAPRHGPLKVLRCTSLV